MRQLHREFIRAGADVIQAFTFSYDDHLGVEHIKYGVSKVYSKCNNIVLSLLIAIRPQPDYYTDDSVVFVCCCC